MTEMRAVGNRAKFSRAVVVLLLSIVTLGLTSRASAQTEVEFDPVAFGLKGYSVHVAEVLHHNQRAQIGAFGYDLPKFFGGDSRFSQRGNGVTVKYDRYLAKRTKGLFLGLDANFARTRYTLDSTGNTTSRNDFEAGPRVGYRFEVGSHLYVTPWLSCGYVFNPGPPVLIDGEKFTRSSFQYFPTVHIGWRF